MQPAIRIALIGFTPFERSHIEAALQPTDEANPAYVLTHELASSSLAVVNADHEAAVAELVRQGRLASAVMLGTTPRSGAAAQLPRPINLVHLLRALDQLAQQAPPMSAAVQRVQEELARLRGDTEQQTLHDVPPVASAAMPLIDGGSPNTVHDDGPAPDARHDHPSRARESRGPGTL